MKNFIHNVIQRSKSRSEGQCETVYELSWDNREVNIQWLTMEKETGSTSFFWESVSAVDTFKRDLFSIDCICLSFETPEGWIEVNEDMKNWGEFLDAAERFLPNFPSQEKWWNKVMVPAFKTNHSRLWERKQQGKSQHSIAASGSSE